MKEIQRQLQESAQSYDIFLDRQMADRFQKYMELLLQWNEKMNLTAITDPDAVVCRHFLDSLLLLKTADLPQGSSLIDVGTGAGFPGIPIKIARPDLRLTLLDSLAKRLNFLGEVCSCLGLEVPRVHARAEEGGRQPALRDQFDAACARAVAPLNLLCEYCLPFVRRGGAFYSMKGPDVEEEISQAQNALKCLGAEVESIRKFTLPDQSGRTILVIRKKGITPEQYPRHGSKIAKKPL